MKANVLHESQERSILATWMRSGTSKALYILKDELPKSQGDWDPVLLALMGTGNQTDGIGGGTPTTSKVAVVSRSTKVGFDVDYTFAQVVSMTGKVDMSGTCGNLAAGVGRFALDQKLVECPQGQSQVAIKVFVTNTGQALLVTVPFPNDATRDIGITFLAPNGPMTGSLFPSGARKDYLSFECPSTGTQFVVKTTLIDCTNPFIFVDSASMPKPYTLSGPKDRQSEALIEAIRRAGAVRMGLARDTSEAGLRRGTPKIALVACPSTVDSSVDVEVTAFSTGVLHPSFQVTGAICLSAALSIPGTVASDLLPSPTLCRESCQRKLQSPCVWRIAHRAGQIHAEIDVSQDKDGEYFVEKGSIVRTARKLFEGLTFYSLR
ncbi:hypothetical protein N7457_000535 [Penicillium paradoxum]|uniref:uncharacterized protein n=1 Tax=Penicillium paradoxum TaxID=176176 RepID=UPI0025489B97|nr:uncharacterized protein N7457_000535 [Penicillium paradoxum]KAJ5793936.1 hypothetical protein N7457_000535 [Penicillium paradoxum]